MYARRVGFFGPNTRSALAQFQREYGLHENVALGTYDDLTRGALFSIVDSSAAEQAATASGTGDGGAGPSSAASPAQEATA
jgi:peptidoglycan hydrolase-like protein with peptidoglycan-binding domain